MRMNKRFIIFLISLLLLLAIPITVLILKKPGPAVPVNNASNLDEVSQFYYRAVPGLKMAEAAGMVRDVNKRLEWPGRSFTVAVDRIWYNPKSVYLFYHVEGMTNAAYLGGELYLPSSEPSLKQPFHGTNSIGRPNEKGIVYNNSYYSCLKLSPLYDTTGEVIKDIDILTYTPFINIPGSDDKDLPESVQLKSFEINLSFHSDDEPVTKVPAGSLLEFDDRQLNFYQVNISPSALSIYFQYLNSGKDKVYRVKGAYTTDKGETYDFDAYADTITEYPYHYSIDLPPLHITPDNLQIYIDSIYCTGTDSVSYEIDTAKYNGKSKTYSVEIGRNQIKSSDLLIEEISLDKQSAEVFIAVKSPEDTSVPYMKIDLSNPGWYRDEACTKNKANALTVTNDDFMPFNLDEQVHGIKSVPDKGVYISFQRDYWNSSKRIRIKLKNLNYIYKIGQKTSLELDIQENQD